MIIGFIGKMGSGKTLCMTMLAHRYHKAGWPVFANYNLAFQHQPLDYHKIKNLESEYNDSFMAIDEIHLFIDSRSAMRAVNRMVSYFVIMSRKQGRMMAYTTQHWGQVDVRLRNNTDFLCKCRSYKLQGKTYISMDIVDMDGKGAKLTMCADPYFSMYDTKQIINPFEDKKDE